jgi:excisionase family DNA binding protein
LIVNGAAIVPDDDWLTVTETAEETGLSVEHVRQMARDGQLGARRTSAGWLIPAKALSSLRLSGSGRLLAPQTAWRVMRLLAATSEQKAPGRLIADRSARHHVLDLIAKLPDPVSTPGPWRRALASRGDIVRLRAHHGVLSHLTADPHVSIGGSEAMPPEYGLTPGYPVLYVSDDAASEFVRRYRLHPDYAGQVTLVTVPADLAPSAGQPVPAPAAAADLLAEDDPRAAHAAASYLGACVAQARRNGWLPR